MRLSDQQVIQGGIEKVSLLNNMVKEETQQLRNRMQSLYKGEKLRSWASEEYAYIQTEIGHLLELGDRIESMEKELQDAKEKVRQVTKGLPYTTGKSMKSRRKREARKKDRKRKQKRSEEAALQVLAALNLEASLDRDIVLDTDIDITAIEKSRIHMKTLVQGLDFLVNKNLLSLGAAQILQENLNIYRGIVWKYFE